MTHPAGWVFHLVEDLAGELVAELHLVELVAGLYLVELVEVAAAIAAEPPTGGK